MRIRSTVAGVVFGAAVLILGAPIAMANNNASAAPAPAPTSSQVTTSPGAPSKAPTTSPAASPKDADIQKKREAAEAEKKREADKAGKPAVVKPKGAPETGGGIEDSSTNTGALVIGGVALVAVAGGGTLALRRARKQN
nr:hypothetical protein [Kibdelosporangium sp. MJ126-NF4]CEL22185.1 hypothetical protein [Kibdelosporangium sp. MJ126-NF4]CTQ92966.1 hypothetical protein [Kibdelosporangium sp. MJ126-NF4]